MPRASRIPATLVTRPLRPQTPKGGPRLWNAKERIRTNAGLDRWAFRALQKTSPYKCFQIELAKHPRGTEEYRKIFEKQLQFRKVEPKEGFWWQMKREQVETYLSTHPLLSKLSEDVQRFILGNPSLDKEQIFSLLRNPTRYFSIPRNVPLEDRQQVYFPDPNDAVVLMRTPHLGPRYAAFDVPLHFNKLDLRAYLKALYNVDVLHIRSTIIQAKISRKRNLSRHGDPRKVRAESKKKMTVLLAKPFVYPEEVTNLEPWENERFWGGAMAEREAQRLLTSNIEPNKHYRESIRDQAHDLVRSPEMIKNWKPTWQEFEQDKRVMEGAVTAPPQTLPSPQFGTATLLSSAQNERMKGKVRRQQALPLR